MRSGNAILSHTGLVPFEIVYETKTVGSADFEKGEFD